MKTFKTVIFLVLILTFNCQERRKTFEVKSGLKTELEKEKSDSNLNIYKKQVSKKYSENVTFRNITDLRKYNGFEKVSAQVLDNTNKALVYIQKDSLKVLILEEIIKSSSSNTSYSILDEVSFTFENLDQYIALTQCKLIESPNKKIIFSLVENDDVEYFDKILKTWIIDLKENKFNEIKSEKVECTNEWFGYDE